MSRTGKRKVVQADLSLDSQSVLSSKKPKFSAQLARARATKHTDCKEALVAAYKEFVSVVDEVMKSQQCLSILR